MKQEFGWAPAIAIAIAAAVGISSQYSGKTSVNTSSPAKVAGQPRTVLPTTANLFATGPCVEIEEHLQTFLRSGNDKSIAAPPSCYGPTPPKNVQFDGKDLRAKALSLRFVIATLPDPLHTHFSLSFDRFTEAVQQGATDEEYTYDSSWLPWETEETKFALIKDEDDAENRKKAREDQPGILLFRKNPARDTYRVDEPYLEGLVVFIVGEEPTQGIHREQFENAAAWIAALQPGTASPPSLYRLPERILGPSFSGSLPSLANSLIDIQSRLSSQTNNNEAKVKLRFQANNNNLKVKLGSRPNTNEAKVLIYSGSVTSKKLVDWFINSLLEKKLKVQFLSFQLDDESITSLYCRYLEKSQFELRHLAILSEDETAYGNDLTTEGTVSSGSPSKTSEGSCQSSDRTTGAARLFYPRDISALRTAYQKESIFNSPASQSTTDAARRTLPTDIADPEGQQHDTIRGYSGNQTALSQEAVLQQIVSLLRVHQSQYILLRSSNPLDQLFLSHYLRMAYPEGRIVIQGGDLLLRRESGAARLSGIMTLSMYPLLPWESHWTRPRDRLFSHSHRVFPHDGTEGTYIATRFLLRPPSEIAPGRDPAFLPTDPIFDIPDYAPPFWIKNESSVNTAEPPPAWLSVLGRDDFWPLAALNDETLEAKPPKTGPAANLFHLVAPRRAHTAYDSWRPWPSIPFSLLTPCETQTAYDSSDHAGRRPWPPIPFSLLTPCEVQTAYDSSNHAGWLPWPPMPLSFKIGIAILTAWAIFHLVWCSLPSLTAKPNHRAYFVCVPQLHYPHRTLLVLGSVALSAMATVIAWGFGAMSPDGIPLTHPGYYLSWLSLLWIIVGSSLAINIWRKFESAFPQSPAPTTMAKWISIWPILAFVAATLGFYLLIYFCLDRFLSIANRIPTYWRDMNLTSGVSPLVPLLALIAGLYMWFWYSLQGLALFGPDRPVLPLNETLRWNDVGWLNMFSRQDAAKPVEDWSRPFDGRTLLVALSLFVILALLGLLLAGEVPLRSLGAKPYAVFICFFMDAYISMMLANAWQLLHVWVNLRQLLTFLDRLRLRRSMAAFPGVSWPSVWKISGNVLDMRYKLLTSQLECVTNLQNSLPAAGGLAPLFKPSQPAALCKSFDRLKKARRWFAQWYSVSWNVIDVRNQRSLQVLQAALADTAGKLIIGTLLPAWFQEGGPLIHTKASKLGGDDDKAADLLTTVAGLEPHLRLAEQFVCYVYLGFIQNILGRMRSLVMSMLWLFIAATIAMASYPFDPRPVVSGVMVLVFLILGTTIVFVYAQMHRDPILSLLTNTNPGELGGDFWWKLVGFGAGPVLGLLATVFPGLTDYIFSWVQPGISSVR